jgi:hypothetical protein
VTGALVQVLACALLVEFLICHQRRPVRVFLPFLLCRLFRVSNLWLMGLVFLDADEYHIAYDYD